MITASDIPVHCAHAALVDVADLRPHPRNPNRHPDKQIALLAKNIRALGWRHPVIVSRLSGCIVAGHGRVEAARVLGVATVPVDYQDFANQAEEETYLLADNRLAELAEIDEGLLQAVLADLPDQSLAGFDAVLADIKSTSAAKDLRSKDDFDTSKMCIVVTCRNAQEQEALFMELTDRGVKCRLSIM